MNTEDHLAFEKGSDGGYHLAPYVDPVPAKRPHKCPICEGHGIVPAGFYNSTPGVYQTTGTTAETCRACGGAGIIWSLG